MSEQRKKVFVSRCFEDMSGKEDVICLYDTNYIPGAREAIFDIKRVASSENSPMIACKIHINKITGQVSNIIPGTDPDTGREYELLKIRDIVNSTELIKGQQSSSEVDYGRDPLPQIISTTMTNYKNRDKLRFIPPSERSNVDSMSNWVSNYIKKLDPSVTDVQYFQWGTSGHVGVIAIDPIKFRSSNNIGSVAFFDYGCMFTDGRKMFSDSVLVNKEGVFLLNENALSFRLIESARKAKAFSEDSREKMAINSLLAQQRANAVMVFGEELVAHMKVPYLPQNFPVIYEKQIGQTSDETDCSYNSEVFYSETLRGELNTLEKFDKFCRTTPSMEDIRNKELKLERSANEAKNLGLSENPSDYPKRTALQGGLSVTEQPKKPKLFYIVEDGNDRSTTLKTSEKSKKVFKDIELIKITPKKVEEGQLYSSKLAEQIEQNGFTKEILENNNITIKRKGVNHFEPLRNFLLKNINKNLVGYNKFQSREIGY